MNIHVPGDVGARTLAIVGELKGLEGPLLPILHEIQAEFGHVPQESLPVIARELNLSRAEVHGVVIGLPGKINRKRNENVTSLHKVHSRSPNGSREIFAIAASLTL